MTPEQYHRMLTGIDGVLAAMQGPPGTLTTEDIELKLQLTLMRAHILRAESGHPFPSRPPKSDPAFRPDPDPEVTTLPWVKK